MMHFFNSPTIIQAVLSAFTFEEREKAHRRRAIRVQCCPQEAPRAIRALPGRKPGHAANRRHWKDAAG